MHERATYQEGALDAECGVVEDLAAARGGATHHLLDARVPEHLGH